MAKAQGQGLLIAFVAVTVLFLACFVTMLLLYQSFSQARSEAQRLAGDLQKARDVARKAVDDRISLVKLIGIGDPDAIGTESDPPADQGTLWAQANAILERNRNRFQDRAINSLVAAIRRLEEGVEQWQDRYTKLEATHNQLRDAFKRIEQEKNEGVARAERELKIATDERQKVESALDEKIAEATKARQELEKVATDNARLARQLRQDLENALLESRRTQEALSAQIRSLRRQLEPVTSFASDPDGVITAVDLGRKEALLDVGSRDGLRTLTRFTVWGREQLATPYWQRMNEQAQEQAKQAIAQPGSQPQVAALQGPKAAIEVVEVLGDHAARARIVYYDPSRPITAGDRIHNPVWSRGRKHRVALAGKFDLDGDGVDDRSLLKQVLARQGCVVDAELMDDGTIQGKITAYTDWLVLGDVPSPEGQAGSGEQAAGNGGAGLPPVVAALMKLREEAANLGVPAMSQFEFYDFLGYQPHSRIYDPSLYNTGYEQRPSAAGRGSGTRTTGVPAATPPGMLRYVTF